MIFKYHFILLRQGFRIMRCYIYKVLTMRLLRQGANSSASCEGRSGKEIRRPLFISKCSGLCLDLPLAVKTVWVSRGHRLSHCNLRAPAINTQQVLPCLL